MAENKISEMIKIALENIKKVADADTIIGQPINTVGETVIIPVSKVSIGFTSGGNDYISKHAEKSKGSGDTNFIGGTGAGVTVSPIAFLIVDKTGTVNIMDVGAQGQNISNDIVSTVAGLADKAPDIVEKIKAAFGKKDKPKGEAKVYENADMDSPQDTL